jgi:hypothetical protein
LLFNAKFAIFQLYHAGTCNLLLFFIQEQEETVSKKKKRSHGDVSGRDKQLSKDVKKYNVSKLKDLFLQFSARLCQTPSELFVLLVVYCSEFQNLVLERFTLFLLYKPTTDTL